MYKCRESTVFLSLWMTYVGCFILLIYIYCFNPNETMLDHMIKDTTTIMSSTRKRIFHCFKWPLFYAPSKNTLAEKFSMIQVFLLTARLDPDNAPGHMPCQWSVPGWLHGHWSPKIPVQIRVHYWDGWRMP